MAAGLGFKTFTTGEVLTAADTNGYLMQGVLVFASAAARDAAITSPQEGQCCYLKDTDAVQTYSGSAWVGFDDSNAIQNSIVDAKGDIVAASGNDTPARLAVGSNGDTLVADSATATGLNYKPFDAAGKNDVINGGFDIWQRGTSFTIASSTQTYTADRWMAYRTATGATVSQQTTSPNYSPYYTRVQRANANTGTQIIYLTQSIETLNSKPLAGKTITLSWWARAGANYSAASSNLTWELAYGTGTDQNMITGFTGQSNITAGTKTLTTSWQQFTTTGTVSTSATQVGINFYFTPVGTAGAADYFDIADVQLELGSTATTFSRAGGTIQGELAACQRYYYRATSGISYAVFGVGNAYSTSGARFSVNYPVTLRTTPSSIDYSTLRVTDDVVIDSAITALTLYRSSQNYGFVDATCGAVMTQFRTYFISSAGSSTAFLGFSAEL
jgi:hypothetical protein